MSTSRDAQLIRPALYNQLKQVFRHVKVSSRGRPNTSKLKTDAEGRTFRYFDKNDPRCHPGEYYTVCCPYCGDTKFRLWINHMWSAYDNATGTRNLWMAHCQRQGCVESFEGQQALFNLVWANGPPGNDVIVKARYENPDLSEFEWPGAVWQLESLQPDHPAKRWLREVRKFDPDWLSQQYRVGYIMEAKPRFHRLTGRIMIPIFHEGKLAGWQVRYVGTPPEGSSIPKYYTGPGTPRGRLLYNYDLARRQDFACVVEGPTDAWRFGPEAVAVLGKPTGHQAELMAMTWKKLVVLLDPDAIRESGGLFEMLKMSGKKVAQVQLPDNKDPGDFDDTNELRRFVIGEARRQGVEID